MIKVITRKTSPIPLPERIKTLNDLMRGWVNSFQYATGYQKLKDLDSWVRCLLRYCTRLDGGAGMEIVEMSERCLRAFLQPGVKPSWAQRFVYSSNEGWAIAYSPIMDERSGAQQKRSGRPS